MSGQDAIKLSASWPVSVPYDQDFTFVSPDGKINSSHESPTKTKILACSILGAFFKSTGK